MDVRRDEEAEDMMNTIINYGEQQEEDDDGSQYLNMSGDGMEIELQDEGHTQSGDGAVTKSGVTSESGKRGAAKRLGAGEKFAILEVATDGEPIAPKENRRKFINQCGVVVRDQIPITTHQWHKPKVDDGRVTFVDERAKQVLWDTLMAHFILPADCDEATKEKVKVWALKKMAIQFQSWKKRIRGLLNKDKNKKEETPVFKGPLEKVKDIVPDFLKSLDTPEFQKRSEINKDNAAKKVHHHTLGTGGYLTAVPKWDKQDADLLAKGKVPGTYEWPGRSRNWFRAHGGGGWTQKQGNALRRKTKFNKPPKKFERQ